MRVGFGITALVAGMRAGGVDGIGSVTRELLVRLRASGSVGVVPFEFAAHVSSEIGGTVAAGSFQRQSLWSLATGLPFPLMQRRLTSQVDLVHATDHMIPRLRGVPVLATLMDAIPLSHPEWVTYRHKSVMNEAWRRSAHWADHVLTISDYSRREIARCFRIPEKRISVIPLGVDERWFTASDDSQQQAVKGRYGLPDRYFLFVGTLQPRKNLALLLQAHEALPATVREECPLVIVGREGWGCDELVARLKSASLPHVRWLDYVPGEDLPAVVHSATALFFPSLGEGFGLPVLEAFAAGTPVAASNTTSLPEVAGNAAILLDPTRVSVWSETMEALISSSSMRSELTALGRERARQYSWQRTADELRLLYGNMLGGWSL